MLWLAEGGHSRPSSGPWGVGTGGGQVRPAVTPQAQDLLLCVYIATMPSEPMTPLGAARVDKHAMLLKLLLCAGAEHGSRAHAIADCRMPGRAMPPARNASPEPCQDCTCGSRTPLL